MAAMATYLTFITACLVVGSAADKPNVVFIMADDLGWNDIGFHNPDIISPNLDALAKSGIILDQYYVQPVCTPSRAALMTGVYPYRLGMSHLVTLPQQDICLPLNRTILPQILKKNGYATHMLGKWHLGFCKWECTPTYRGFDTFYGFYNGGEDHYTKQVGGGFDFRSDKEVDIKANMTYSSYLYGEKMEEIINNHNVKDPLFMYMAFHDVHEPMQAPDKFLNMYPKIKNSNRRFLSAMMTALDEAVGKLVTSLTAKGMMNNTLIIFSADNGGWTQFGGNNYPLRGGKISIFEGGTRAVGFMHGPMLAKNGTKFDGLMHAVDWFPTIAEAAGISDQVPDQDGMSQWSAINSRSPPKRQEIVYNLDYHPQPLQGQAAIRVGDYKLIDGYPGLYQGWVKPDTVDEEDPWDGDATLTWPSEKTMAKSGDLYGPFNKYLFNLKDDPTEHNNLYYTHHDIAKQLEAKLDEAKKGYVPPYFPANNPKSNPSNFGGVWTPGWC